MRKVVNGPCDLVSGYGIRVAELCHFPPDMIARTREIQSIVQRHFLPRLRVAENAIDRTSSIVISLMKKLLPLGDATLGEDGKRDYLQSIAMKLTQGDRNMILGYVQQTDEAQLSVESKSGERARALVDAVSEPTIANEGIPLDPEIERVMQGVEDSGNESIQDSYESSANDKNSGTFRHILSDTGLCSLDDFLEEELALGSHSRDGQPDVALKRDYAAFAEGANDHSSALPTAVQPTYKSSRLID
jgi:hypothetical protein